MNPLSAHWLRIALWLLIGTPAVAFAVMLSTGIRFGEALMLTLYTWLLVCVILALIALVGLILRLLGRGMRALRR